MIRKTTPYATVPEHLRPSATQAKCACGYSWQPRGKMVARCPKCGEKGGIQIEAKPFLPYVNGVVVAGEMNGSKRSQPGWEKSSSGVSRRDAFDAQAKDDGMLPEYDFSEGIRNPYAERFQELNLVSLDADVKAVFPDSEAVNSALRTLIKAAGVVVPEQMKKAS